MSIAAFFSRLFGCASNRPQRATATIDGPIIIATKRTMEHPATKLAKMEASLVTNTLMPGAEKNEMEAKMMDYAKEMPAKQHTHKDDTCCAEDVEALITAPLPAAEPVKTKTLSELTSWPAKKPLKDFHTVHLAKGIRISSAEMGRACSLKRGPLPWTKEIDTNRRNEAAEAWDLMNKMKKLNESIERETAAKAAATARAATEAQQITNVETRRSQQLSLEEMIEMNEQISMPRAAGKMPCKPMPAHLRAPARGWWY